MLLTKLHTPSTGKNYVHRPHLFDQLNEGLNRKLILVSAPAGFGKTSLMSDWIGQTTRVLGFGGVFKADLVEEAKKEMLADYELQANQALANVTVGWKHSRYILVKTTKCSVSADVVEFNNEALVSNR